MNERPANLHEAAEQELPATKVTRMDAIVSRRSRRLSRGMRFALAAAALLLLPVGLCVGAVRYYNGKQDLAAAAEQHRDYAPNVRVAVVRASDEMMTVSLTSPATTVHLTCSTCRKKSAT